MTDGLASSVRMESQGTGFRGPGVTATLVAVLASAMLGACDSGGGVPGEPLYFGIRGSDSCDRVIVGIDLDLAGADLVFNPDGSPACEPTDELEFCEMRIDDVDTGFMRVTMEGCDEVRRASTLFSCRFREPEISRFESATSALCDCGDTNNCDSGTPVCTSETKQANDCERCDNDIDDDHDGDTDCDDANCRYSGFCVTPSTIPQTTTTSSTASPSTSTERTPCEVTFRLISPVPVGAVRWITDYSDSFGYFDFPDPCDNLVDGAEAEFRRYGPDQLESRIETSQGVSGKVTLSTCNFVAYGIGAESDEFEIEAVEATAPDLTPILPPPTVKVIVGCPFAEISTTSTSTTLLSDLEGGMTSIPEPSPVRSFASSD
jgi:hypothetical protein